MDYSPPGSSVHEIFQARVLECGAIAFHIVSKRVHQGCILSSCLFNLHAEYIMRNTGLEKAQVGIKTAGRNINNLRYADNTEKAMEEPGGLLSTGSLGVGHD